MNELIASVFGDGYITLTCGGGECLHHSQTPGYQVVLLSFILQVSDKNA